MKRRDFLFKGILAAGAAPFVGHLGYNDSASVETDAICKSTARNIIFLVSDGMSSGTLAMADHLFKRKMGRLSTWMQLYHDKKITRAIMDTASANSMITDSAAASSAWGGGVRVVNGALNMGANGEEYEPILQKFKASGKSVGCVTTVPITHATPAGFCVNMPSRNQQAEIAEVYKSLKFDVMMGGGNEYFNKDIRSDGRDMYAEFSSEGFQVVRDKKSMQLLIPGAPILGVFSDSGVPYTVDQQSDNTISSSVPTLAEMTRKAIECMSLNKKGFVLQVEGGKVDWAAHANDTSALVYDQIAFDDAVTEAINFAEMDKKTLVIITTDHGNGNPALIYGSKADTNFDRLFNVRQSNEWILDNIKRGESVASVRERIEHAWGVGVKAEEASEIQAFYNEIKANGDPEDIKKPFRPLALLQEKYFSVGWACMQHTSDFVEFAAFGPAKDLFPAFLLNTDVHHLMLKACGVENK
ncbi:MAG: alkaline phosphatase [Saprospiraceae bacterium]|nr:alkaline phosphatase [Saprospiraceae bacterium]